MQLHDLRDAVTRWQQSYHQRAWLRQLTPSVTAAQEDRLLQVIARLDGVSFPRTARLAWRWLSGRDAHLSGRERVQKRLRPEVAYCAEVVGVTYEEMGLLADDVPANWYDPGTFWSGDRLPLRDGWALGAEVAVGESA